MPVGAGIGIGQVAEPAPADGAGSVASGGTSNTSSMPTAEAVKDGAMTAPEPNHSPISAAGGASPCRAAACATARSTAGALPRSPSRSIRTG